MQPHLIHLRAVLLHLPLLAFVVTDLHAAHGQTPFGKTTTTPHLLTLLEAAQLTLEKNPLLLSQAAQVEINRGRLEVAVGAFDTLLQGGVASSRTSVPLTAEQQQQDALIGSEGAEDIADATDLSFGVSRLFRNGISLSPTILVNRTTDNIGNLTGANTSLVTIAGTVPLLRGRGRTSTDAPEIAARRELTASELDTAQLAAQLVLTTATDYWAVLAATRDCDIAVDAENRGIVYLRNVTALVDADHVPGNDLNEVRANLAQRTAIRVAAEQQLVAAQSQLGLDMGLDSDDLALPFPNLGQPFPIPEMAESQGQLSPSALTTYLRVAEVQRSDFRASHIREAEQSGLVGAAQNALLPQLNLTLSVGYSGLQEGRKATDFFTAIAMDARSPSAGAGLNFSFPPNNHAARGALLQAQQTLRQNALQSSQVDRQISSSLTVAVNNVATSRARVSRTSDAVRAYEAALQGERDKYAGGIGSIAEIFTVEDRLTAALMDSVAAEQLYATAIAQFRFATGTLLSADKPLLSLSDFTFTTVPVLASSEPHLR